jgi:hypothetical protein
MASWITSLQGGPHSELAVTQLSQFPYIRPKKEILHSLKRIQPVKFCTISLGARARAGSQPTNA